MSGNSVFDSSNELEALRRDYARLAQQLENYQKNVEAERQERLARLMRDNEQKQHEASDWPEAFQKGISAARREADKELKEHEIWEIKHPGEVDPASDWKSLHEFFTKRASEWQQAQTIYNRLRDSAQEQIDEILDLVQSMAATEIEKAGLDTELVEALRHGAYDYLVDW